MSVQESSHTPIPDNCAWCVKALDAPDDAWRRMSSVDGMAHAANYCAPTDAERVDGDGLSRCRRTGLRNPHTVAQRLAAWRDQAAS